MEASGALSHLSSSSSSVAATRAKTAELPCTVPRGPITSHLQPKAVHPAIRVAAAQRQTLLCASMAARGSKAVGRCQASADAAAASAAAAVVGGAAEGGSSAADEDLVKEVDKDSYEEELERAGDRLVVLDMFTQWCGPCKLLFPKILAYAKENRDVVFLKLDCNQYNKVLAKSLGVQVVPTFKLIKNKEIIDEVRGAKFDVLVEAIQRHR